MNVPGTAEMGDLPWLNLHQGSHCQKPSKMPTPTKHCRSTLHHTAIQVSIYIYIYDICGHLMVYHSLPTCWSLPIFNYLYVSLPFTSLYPSNCNARVLINSATSAPQCAGPAPGQQLSALGETVEQRFNDKQWRESSPSADLSFCRNGENV